MTVHQRVRRFHELCDIPNADKPGQITPDRRALRVRLLCEEFCEVLSELMPSKRAKVWIDDFRAEVTEDCEMYVFDRDRIDLAALAKELADLEVVTVGCAAEFGLPHDQVADLVMDSNDAKAGGPVREDGKVMRPEGWTKPDVAGLLESGVRP